MFKSKICKLYSIILTLYIPIILLVSSLIENINYDKNSDPGGWGGLAIAGSIIISIIWLLVVLFINYIIKRFVKNDFNRSIFGIVLSIINLIIYLNTLNFFGNNMMELICILNIIIILTYVIFVVIIHKGLKLMNYSKYFNFKIIILIIYSITHIVAWHLGKYLPSSEAFRGISYEPIAFLLIIIWGTYYFINTIKNNKYVTKLELIIYNIFNIINSMSLSNFAILEDVGFGGPGMAALMSFLYSLIPVVYLLLLNLILYIRFKTKRCIANTEYKLSVNLISIIFYIIICISPFLYGYIGTTLCESKALNLSIDYLIKEYGDKEYKIDKEKCVSYECEFVIKTNKNYERYIVDINKDTFKILSSEELKCLGDKACLKAAEDTSLEYMKNKYGKNEFELIDVTEDKNCVMFDCYKHGYLVTLKSKTLGDNFIVRLNNDLKIIDEDFTFSYLSKLTNSDIYDYNDLYLYFKKDIIEKFDNDITTKYNIELTEKTVHIDMDKLENINYNKLPSLNDLVKLVKIDDIKFVIKDNFNVDQKDECVEYIKNILDYMCENYDIEGEDTNIRIEYSFSYDNPFTNNKFYIDGGYIRVTNNTYDIYLDATPTIVKR